MRGHTKSPYLPFIPRIVRRDRCSFYVVGSLVVLGFLCVAAYTVVEAHNRRDEPPTRIKLDRAPFPFPRMVICAVEDESLLKVDWAEEGTPGLQCEYFEDAEAFRADRLTNCTVERVRADGLNCVEAFLDEVVAADRETVVTVHLPFNATYTGADPGEPLDRFRGVANYLVAELLHVDGDGNKVNDAENPATTVSIPFSSETRLVIRPTVFRRLGADKPDWSYSVSVQSATIEGPHQDVPPHTNKLVSLHVASDNGMLTTVSESDPTDPVVLAGALAGFWGIALTVLNVLFVSVDADTRRALWKGPAPDDADDAAGGLHEPAQPAKAVEMGSAAADTSSRTELTASDSSASA